MPRFCLTLSLCCHLLAYDFLPSNAFSNDTNHGGPKALTVSKFSIVETESLFIQIPKQAKGFNRNVGSVQSALREAPEVLHSIGMNLSAHVFCRMVHHPMLKIVEPFIRFQRISVDRRSRY